MLDKLQQWFDFDDLKTKKYSKSIWIPLRISQDVIKEGRYGYDGYQNEYFGLSSVIFPVSKKEEVLKLTWSDISLDSNNKGYVEDGQYINSDIYTRDIELQGFYAVLTQHFNTLEINQWHVHQDIVLSLNLLRENDVWLSPNEGYIEVIRLKRDHKDQPCLIEIRAEHLKDYLCARCMGLYLSMFSSRDAIFEEKQNIIFNFEDNDFFRYEGWESEIHEGSFGMPFGEGMSVFHAARNDVNDNDDLPDISGIPTDKNITSNSWQRKFDGKKLYKYTSEIWKTEWIESALKSPRIKEDKVSSTIYFLIDEQGNKENKDTLKDSGRWLWFKPDVISALLNYRGSSLQWYSQDTGKVGCSPDNTVHFGVNNLGLINVFAKDIVFLPDWQQQIWVGFNTSPEGGVSKELLASQVHATPANTQAPELFLYQGLQLLNEMSKKELNILIFKKHNFHSDLNKKIHRFRATDETGLFELAKDIARITADSFDAGVIQTVKKPAKGEQWGSIKSIEKLISEKVQLEIARKITAPLVGIYELRLADAHLPSSKIDEAYELIGIDKKWPYIKQGHYMLHKCVTSIYAISDILKKWKEL